VSIKNNANHFSTKLKNILKKYPLSSRIYAIEKIEYRIEEILTQLHENASEDILEKNFIGEYDPV
jgi:ribosomal protein S20